MQPSLLTPIVVQTVIADLARPRHQRGPRAGDRRPSPLAALRGRLAARRGAPPAPSLTARPTARPGRA